MSILVLRPGLFHRIKANNRKDLFALEIENLYIRSNLIRMLDCYEKERSKFLDWSPLGGAILKESEWKQMFKFLNYKGDYYFSGPKSYGL